MRKCPLCGETFPHTIEYFARNKNRNSGLTSACRPCTAKRMKKWRKDNREHYRSYQKKWLRENPAAVMYREWRKAGCAVCGFNDWRAMVAHHVDPAKKDAYVCFITNPQQMAEELAKCVPLCANHHAIVHDELRHGQKGLSLGDVIESIQRQENA